MSSQQSRQTINELQDIPVDESTVILPNTVPLNTNTTMTTGDNSESNTTTVNLLGNLNENNDVDPYIPRPADWSEEDQQKVLEYINMEISAVIFTYDPEDIEDFQESEMDIIKDFFHLIQECQANEIYSLTFDDIPFMLPLLDVGNYRRVIEKWRRNRNTRWARLYFHKSDMNIQKGRQPVGSPTNCVFCCGVAVHSIGCGKCKKQVGCLGCCKSWIQSKLQERNKPSCPLCRAEWATEEDVINFGETN